MGSNCLNFNCDNFNESANLFCGPCLKTMRYYPGMICAGCYAIGSLGGLSEENMANDCPDNDCFAKIAFDQIKNENNSTKN